LKRLCEHEEAAKEAAEQENSMSTFGEIALTIGALRRINDALDSGMITIMIC